MDKQHQIESEINQLKEIANKEQATASNPAYSVWVEASAGTGKTKVLSDRVLRLLLSGVEPSKILCLTYTKAAAAEMKTRINDRLSKWVIISEQELIKDLEQLYCRHDILKAYPDLTDAARKLFAKVLDAPNPIKIETIHAFCTEILKRFPLEAGVSPYFEVSDEQTTNEILDDIGSKLLKTAQERNNSDMTSAALYLTSHIKELKWQDFVRLLIQNRHAFLKLFMKFPTLEDFKKALCEKLHLETEPSKEKYLQKFLEGMNEESLKRCATALTEGAKDTDRKRGKALFELLEKFDFDAYFDLFLTSTGSGMYKSRDRLACGDVLKKHPEVDDILRLEAVRLLMLYEHLKSVEVYEATLAVATVALTLIQDYTAYKKEKSCMDFDDLIMTTCQLLEKKDVSAWVLYKLDNGIDHILIDEAQDTSPYQWRIIEALSGDFFSGIGQKTGKRTIFAVGDRKQSIFGFQGAEPQWFDDMRRQYESKIAKTDFKNVELRVSFRSTKAVLDMVNTLFSLEEAKSGVVNEGCEVKHLPFRLGESGLVEIWPLTEADDKDDKIWEEPIFLKQETSATTKLAFKIAKKIQTMVLNQEILESAGRAVQYSDFMVLVWHRNPFMEEFVRACKQIGVNVTGIDRLHLSEEIVVEDLCSLSQFLLLPYDDLNLACVLRSPLYGLSEDDLFELCYNRGEKMLWQRLKENTKYTDVYEELSSLLGMADYMRPFELFDTVLNVMGGKKRFFERLGAEAKDAIDEFMNLTLKFEANHIPNLQNFIAWLEQNDIEIKRELEQATTNAVRLMTVHTSKGLQAPIVILPDTMRSIQNKREQNIIFDDDVFYFPLSAEQYNENCNKGNDARIKKEEDEYRRLLYVAATRAEDRLYVAGAATKKTEGDNKTWYQLIDAALNTMPCETEKGKKTYVSAQQKPVEKNRAEDEISSFKIEDASWIYEKPEKEDDALKTYSPSHLQDMEDEAVSSPIAGEAHNFKRGILIHKLLQMLPQYSSFEKQSALIKTYLLKQTDLSDAFKQSVEKEVLSVLSSKDFAFVFEGNSRAEVPVMGMVDGKVISGQIDRLIVSDKAVVIVDFKTNRPAAGSIDDVSAAYKAQLDIYAKLIGQIYPTLPIEKYILWTNTLKLMKI